MSLSLKLAAVAILALPTALVPAQDLGALLRGQTLPNKIKPADIGEDMRAVKIVHEKQGGGGDIFSMLMNPMMMMMGAFGSMGGSEEKPADPDQAAGMVFFDKLSISWTNGSTVKLYEQDFLVTYAVQVNMAEVTKLKSPPDLSKYDLTLSLINTKHITAITPRPDMTKEEWLKPAPAGGGGSNVADGKTATVSNAKQMSLALMMYAGDYDDDIPYVQSTKAAFEVIYPYMKNKDITKSLNPDGAKFLLNMALAGVNMATIESPAETVMFYEDKPWADGTRVVSFTDGHVKRLSAEEWERYKPTLSLKLTKKGKPLPATLGSTWDGT